MALLSGAIVVACDGAGDGARPTSAPAHRETTSIDFADAIARGDVQVRPYNLGPIHRTTLQPRWRSERPGSSSFESDPIEALAGDHLLLGLGLLSMKQRIPEEDRPRFRADAVGPRGEAPLVDLTGQTDFPIDEWIHRRVVVPAGLGSPIRLRLSVARSGEVPVRAMPLWSTPRLVRASTRSRPNVIFVVFDTLRADHTQPYGYERPTTPFLAELATSGTLVEELVATYPTTLSSHWSIFTGLFPARHGMYPEGGRRDAPAKPLAEYFQEAGYRTAAFTEGGFVHSLFGFGRGFDLYHDGPTKDIHDLSGSARRTFSLADRWLASARDEPFFLFLHTYHVHTPYDPDEASRARFVGDYDGRWSEIYPALAAFAINEGQTTPTQAERDHIVDLYDAEIRELDGLFASLWQRLEQRGVLEDTIVVITSDHGEDLFEHGWVNHGTTLHDPALLVPLIFIAPGRVAADARLACQWSQPDLMPTILELAGLSPPEGLDGRSRAPELRTGTCDGDSAAFSELLFTPYDRHEDTPMASLRRDGWKLIRHLESGELESFDLRADPAEREEASGPLLERLQRELDAYIESRPATVAPDAGEMPEDVRARLEALGYVE